MRDKTVEVVRTEVPLPTSLDTLMNSPTIYPLTSSFKVAASVNWSTIENPRGASQEAAYFTPDLTVAAPLPDQKDMYQ